MKSAKLMSAELPQQKNQNHLHDLLKYEKLVFHQTF